MAEVEASAAGPPTGSERPPGAPDVGPGGREAPVLPAQLPGGAGPRRGGGGGAGAAGAPRGGGGPTASEWMVTVRPRFGSEEAAPAGAAAPPAAGFGYGATP